MSQYLHATLRGLVELPALPHNRHDSLDDSAAANATGPTVEERINMCDAYGRYAAGDFAGSGDDDDDAGTDTSSNDSKEEKRRGMMSHGAVDGYLDLHPGGVVAANNNSDASDTSSANPPTTAQMSAVQPAGGIVLPPLDWNASKTTTRSSNRRTEVKVVVVQQSCRPMPGRGRCRRRRPAVGRRRWNRPRGSRSSARGSSGPRPSRSLAAVVVSPTGRRRPRRRRPPRH